MCNFRENLVAWSDGELSPELASEVESHLQSCGECRQRVSRYESVSRDFAAYYLDKAEPQPVAVPANRISRWMPYAAAAAVILIAALLALPRPDKKAPQVRKAAKVTAPAPVESLAEPEPAAQPSPKAVPYRRVVRHQSRNEEPQETEAAIQIAIPAEAMFPPGAVPEGVAYIASLASDGSIQSIRLQP